VSRTDLRHRPSPSGGVFGSSLGGNGLFGIYRYVLAIMVVFAHLWGQLDGRMNWLGLYAVFSFYLLSGYLMTLVLNERYGFTRSGLARYFVNRCLRIYPIYWVFLIFSGAVVLLDPMAAVKTTISMRLPQDAGSWLKNIAILGLHVDPTRPAAGAPIRLIPPAWTLSVELIFYVAMGALSRSRRIIVVWVSVSLGYTAFAIYAGWSANYRVSTVLAASLPFSLGALIYHLPSRPRRWPVLLVVGLAFGVNAVLASRLWGSVFLGGLYASLFLSFVLVMLLRPLKGESLHGLSAIDRFLGDLSYPIFLCHFAVAVLVVSMWRSGRYSGPLVLAASLPLIHLVSIAGHRLIDRGIEPIRRRIRVGALAAGRIFSVKPDAEASTPPDVAEGRGR
jgi:peptidoglycan/LPS O-acetylase OafA/YrhL